MTAIIMNTNRRPPVARCTEIREKLPDFAADRLGPTATGEVQGHLLSCQACSEVFGDLVMEEVESGAVPLLTPPRIPPIEWYDAYMRAGSGRFGTFWKSVGDALQATDAGVRAWASARRDEIAQAIEALADPDPFGGAIRTRGAVRARGAVRTRGAVTPPSRLPGGTTAEVVSAAGRPTGAVVRFSIDEQAHVTRDRRFCLRLSTDDDAHDGHIVICTLTLPGGATVSFAGTVTPRPGGRLREVRIDEAGVPASARTVPPDRVALAVIVS
jgi:hypothetical protein